MAGKGGGDKLKVKRTETVSGTVAADNYEARVSRAGGGGGAGKQQAGKQKAGKQTAGKQKAG